MIKRLNLGELIQFSFGMAFKKFGVFALSFLLLILMSSVGLAAFVGMLFAFGAMDSYLGPVGALRQMSAGQVTAVILALVVLYCLIAIVMVWMMAFNANVVLSEVKQTHKTIGESFAYSFKKMPTFLLYGLIMFVISLVVSIPYLMSYIPVILKPEEQYSPVMMIAMLFTYIASGSITTLMALVPGFILDEELTAVAAMKKSFNTVKGQFWRTILYLLLVLLILFAAVYLLIIIFVLVGVVVFMANMSFAVKAIFVTLAVLVYLFIYIVMLGVWISASVNLYKQLYLDTLPVEDNTWSE